jgi:histidinol-phosphate aminotransferase
MLADGGDGLPPVSSDLSSNENAFGPSPRAVAAARASLSLPERYRESAAKELAEAIAERFGLDAGRIVVGHGSDDLLARLARAFLNAGSELVHSRNGYLKFPNYAHANDARPVPAADRCLRADVDGILACLTKRTRAVFLANPDNPSGSYLPGAEIRRLHAGLPERVLLVLDSAYAEYVDATDYEPPERLVDEAPNVAMTRTFSKIFGLAGLRLGWLYGPPLVADAVRRIGVTFPVSTPAVAAGSAALADRAHAQMVFASNGAIRRSFSEELCRLGLHVHPSQANFVLVRFDDEARPAAAAYKFLRATGIVTRRFASPAYNDHIRITLGPNRELSRAARGLAAFLTGAA